MPLELHMMTEADMADFEYVQSRAFQGGLADFIFPGPKTPEKKKEDIERNIKVMREEPDAHFVKVVDTDLGGKTIACAKWRVNTQERPEEVVEAQMKKLSDDASPALIEFAGWLRDMRLKWMGTKPYYCEFV